MPNNSEAWTEEENQLMRLLYPDKSQIEIMQALPRRAWNRILERAPVLNLRRRLSTSVNFNGPHPVNPYHWTVSYGDLEAVAQLVQTEEEKNRVRQIINELAKKHGEGTSLCIGGSLSIASALAVLMGYPRVMKNSSMSAHSHA